MAPVLHARIGAFLRRLAGERGQSFVEFTLILPIAMVLILGVVDLGKATSYWLDSSHLANEAARAAAVGSCPGCASYDAPALVNAIKNQAETGQLKSAATVCVQDLEGSTWAYGDRVKVTVTSNYNFLAFLKLPPITIHGTSTMRIENTWPTPPAAAVTCST